MSEIFQDTFLFCETRTQRLVIATIATVTEVTSASLKLLVLEIIKVIINVLFAMKQAIVMNEERTICQGRCSKIMLSYLYLFQSCWLSLAQLW